MHLRYDEDFVEAAIFRCTSGRRKGVPPLQIARFNRQHENLYSILDPEDRDRAFFRLHLEWFREWGLAKLLTDRLLEFPLLSEALNVLAFCQSRRRHDEGAELYVNEAGERSGVVALQPERFEREVELASFLRHEFTHLHDMVDPAFGYVPELAVSNASLPQRRLARERYRLLWDITVDGRLTRAGHHPMASRDQRWSEFADAFTFWTQARLQEVFYGLWTDPAPTHRLLTQLVCDPRRLQCATGPHLGVPCPLCGFPTFEWADQTIVADQAEAIRAEFPRWTPERGACARCSKIYRANRSRLPLVP